MEDLSLVALIGRLAFSLAVVFGLMVLSGRVARRRGLGLGRSQQPAHTVEVLARQGLGRHSSLTVVRVAGKVLVLGVGESQISLLSEQDDAPPLDVTAPVGRHASHAGARRSAAARRAGLRRTPLTLGVPAARAPHPTTRSTQLFRTAEPSGPLDWSSFVETLKDRTARRC